MIVRPIQRSDLAALFGLASFTGGLTTLPANEERLAQRIGWAESSFAGAAESADSDYLFVLEDDEWNLLGVSAISGAVGLRAPWYNYRVGLTVTASQELGLYKQIPTLFLANDLTGSSALCSLFLHPQWREDRYRRLLSKARLLFIAEFPALFAGKLISEMRGIADSEGRSAFWDSLGRHFFRMEFSQADYLTGVGNRTMIAELMPKFPLYTCFLSDEAQRILAETHPDALAASAVLQEEGFAYQGYVDIFDAGPVLEAETARVRTVRDSQCLVLAVGTPGDDAPLYLIHNRRQEGCRITAAAARQAAGTLVVDSVTARRLNLVAGDSVRAVTLS